MIFGLELSYTEPETGSPHPSSFWRLHSFEFDFLHDADENVQTTAVFWGWHDRDAYDDRLQHEPTMAKSIPLPLGPVNGAPTVGDALDGIYGYAQAIDADLATGTPQMS